MVALSCYDPMQGAVASKQIALSVSDVSLPQKPQNDQWIGEYTYFGGMKWRMLGKERGISGRNMVLFLDQVPESYEEELRLPLLPQEGEESFDWDTSHIRRYLNEDFLETAFLPQEQQMIEITNVRGHFNDRIFPLSFKLFEEEWNDMGFGEENEGLHYKEAWWACEDENPIRIEADGTYRLYKSDEEYSERLQRLHEPAIIRPCCIIDPNKICFVKDASLPVSMEVSEELAVFDDTMEASGEWSFVISSAEQHVTIEDVSLDEDVCSFRYSHASTGPGNGLYAMIEGDGQVYAYGKIADTSRSDSGTVSIRLPDFYNRYMALSVFSEKERISREETGYASERVYVLRGKDAAEEPLVSAGELVSEYIPLPCDPIIDPYYDRFLIQWDYEDYQNADEKERLEIGTAAMIYQAILSRQGIEGDVPKSDIESAEEYAANHQEDMLALGEAFFENVHKMGFKNLKEAMDYAKETVWQLSDARPVENADLGEYLPYLVYTYREYQEAEEEEQKRAITAAILYLVQYRMGVEISEEEAVQQVEGMKESIEILWEIDPDSTLKKLMDRQQ